MPIKKSNDYRETLVELVKMAATTILNNADNIVARVPYSTGFDICIHFAQGLDASLPEIEITQTFLPDPNEICKVLYRTEAKED